MRAAAAVFGDDREMGLKAMRAEARRIQERVAYEKEIRLAMLRRASSIDSDSDNGDDADRMADDDQDEWWRDLQDGRIKTDDIGTGVKPRQPINTPNEATGELFKFRPLRESVEELRRLLTLRADPNAPVSADGLSPLQNVMTFAPEQRVATMRDLLMEHGAVETEDDKKRWVIRQDADRFEPHRVRDFYGDDRHLSPVGAAMDI
jgi:hypothetical protein